MTVQTDFMKRCEVLNLHDGKLSDWLDEIESLRQQLADSQKQSIEDSENILRLIETIKYLQGIAVRGSGIDQSDDQTVEQFVLSYVKGLEQQLSAALAACKLKDEALRESGRLYCTMIGNDFINQPSMFERSVVAKYVRGWFRHNQPSMVKNALTVQPDDSALRAWLGGPVAWKHDDPKRHDAITDSVKELLHRANSEYMHRPIDKTEHYTIPLYSPKRAQNEDQG